MIELSSTPIMIIIILGVAGVILPVINVIRKEKGSNSFYAVIAFAALIISIAYVGYQFVNENVLPSALFSEDVVVDDAFGGFFAIAMLIVAIFTTVGSFNYMRKQNYPAIYYSLILLSYQYLLTKAGFFIFPTPFCAENTSRTQRRRPGLAFGSLWTLPGSLLEICA